MSDVQRLKDAFNKAYEEGDAENAKFFAQKLNQLRNPEQPASALEGLKKGALTGASDLGTFLGTLTPGGYLTEQMKPSGAPSAQQENREFLAKRGLGYRHLDELPQLEREAAVFGETATNALASTYPIFRLSKGGALGKTAERMARSPAAFGATEGASAITSGMGAVAADQMARNDPYARLFGEVLGGTVFNPVRIAHGAKAVGSGAYSKAFSGSARQDRASQHIKRALKVFEEDPTVIAKRAEGAGSIAETGSAGLAALANRMAASDPEFAGSMAKQLGGLTKNLMTKYNKAVAGGDGNALRTAALGINKRIRGVVASHARRAEEKAAQARAKVGGTESMEAKNLQAKQIIQDAYDDALKTQREMWEAPPKNVVVEFRPDHPFAAAWRKANEGLLPGEKIPLPEPVLNILNKFRPGATQDGAEIVGVTAGNLDELRKRLSNFKQDMRMAAHQGRSTVNQMSPRDVARRTRILQRGIEDELALVDPGYALARQFTHELRGRFSKGYVGRVMRETRTGDVIPDQLTLQNMGTGPRAKVAADELKGAAAFPSGSDMGPLRAGTMDNLVADQLRTQARKAKTPEALREFMTTNQDVLGRLPRLKTELDDAVGLMEESARKAASVGGLKALADKRVFAKLVGTDDTASVIRKAWTKPRERMDLIRAAKRGGDAAKADLRGEMFAKLLDDATDGGGVNIPMIRRAISSDPFFRQAIANKVIDRTHLKALRDIEKAGRRVEKWRASGKAIGDIADNPSILESLMARISGANMAGLIPSQGMGSPLIVAHAGSRAFQDLLFKQPGATIKGIVKKAYNEPDFMALLLRRPTSKSMADMTFTEIVKKLKDDGIDITKSFTSYFVTRPHVVGAGIGLTTDEQ